MTFKTLTIATVLIISGLALTGCGNTIRGMGKDTASAVNATQAAGQDVERAAQ
ncbi:entericidin [Rhizobium sp. S153]|uniref:Entericidin n=1 Tax=Ciceribacter sichuanensis TaxID=2949647 RepID=A0ABT0VE66_9HYPH|nr:entericidin [Ciceribacter sp. S153]MCM2404192.1 entericidin [Ciceribacter sp. S153]